MPPNFLDLFTSARYWVGPVYLVTSINKLFEQIQLKFNCTHLCADHVTSAFWLNGTTMREKEGGKRNVICSTSRSVISQIEMAGWFGHSPARSLTKCSCLRDSKTIRQWCNAQWADGKWLNFVMAKHVGAVVPPRLMIPVSTVLCDLYKWF